VFCLTAWARLFEAITEFVGRQVRDGRVGPCAGRISATKNLFYLLSFRTHDGRRGPSERQYSFHGLACEPESAVNT
jgi:hypothetical protein